MNEIAALIPIFHYSIQVLDKCLPILPQVDRMAMLNANVIDLQWIADRTGGHWITGHVEGNAAFSLI